jgi:hypothetical protein
LGRGHAVIARSGRYRRLRLHEDTIKLPGTSFQVRQIANVPVSRHVSLHLAGALGQRGLNP